MSFSSFKSFISLRNSGSTEIEQIKCFLKKHEKSCVSLIQNLSDSKYSVYFVKHTDILAVISISTGGNILHCIPNPELIIEAEQSFAKIISKQKLFCINGEEKGSLLLLEWIKKHTGKNPVHVNNYLLMDKSLNNFIADTPDYTVKKCSEESIQSLLPLELAYQKEEVFFNDRLPEPAVFSLYLSKIIKNFGIFAAEINNKIISMAAYSAESWNFALIGGIYTLPEFRRQGFCKATLKALFNYLKTKEKNPVLFVNIKNQKALNLYKNLGFTEISPYTVIYF